MQAVGRVGQVEIGNAPGESHADRRLLYVGVFHYLRDGRESAYGERHGFLVQKLLM
jgi:hypothetical protein